MSYSKSIALLTSGTVDVLPREDFEKKIASGKPLTVKLGVDPTAPDLHLGHAVVLNKLRQFQDLGHNVIFLIGDFTTRIGDPTGRSKTRPPLSDQEITRNAQTYFDQVQKVLDPKKTIVRYNSEWFSTMPLADFIKLCGSTSLARIIERDDFHKRLSNNVTIGIHELLYPLLQGYDSVALKADIELGGTDQTFNLLMGRYLQQHYGQSPQVVITTPLLIGLDGVNKMSKSANNYIGLWEEATVAFGKVMSISDELMWNYYQLLTDKTAEDVARLQKDVATGSAHPMKLKKELAYAIVARYWSKDEAQIGREHFEAIFQKHDYSHAQEIPIPPAHAGKSVWIIELLKDLGAIASSSEGKRLIESKSIYVDDQSIDEFKAELTCKSGMVIKVGKKKIYRLE